MIGGRPTPSRKFPLLFGWQTKSLTSHLIQPENERLYIFIKQTFHRSIVILKTAWIS